MPGRIIQGIRQAKSKNPVFLLDEVDTRSKLLAYSPAAKVPILIDRSFPVWDSLAIMEYLHEANPEAGVWPEALQERARARSISAEMHSGLVRDNKRWQELLEMNEDKHDRELRFSFIGMKDPDPTAIKKAQIERKETLIKERSTFKRVVQHVDERWLKPQTPIKRFF